MDIERIATEALPGLVVLLIALMRVQYLHAVLTYEAAIQRLEEELAFLRPVVSADKEAP